ncbi:MAG TPA: type II restriction endonuclease [Pyrinomonadaceae bacterium]|nr:type II restriction endonuclease [Pyrinomonadaceae bacterium]
MAALADLTDWMDEHTGPHIVWYVKRLAANDTLATGAHQAGPYIPKEFLFEVFPSLNRPDAENPDKRFELRVDSHPDAREVRAVWYNNKLRGGTRNEARLTNFGGGKSALLDPESTGSIAIFAFHRGADGEASVCYVWVCDHETEEDAVEDRIGPVEPGHSVIWSVDESESSTTIPPSSRASCWLSSEEIPSTWLVKFPTATEIIRYTINLCPGDGLTVDKRLLQRRACEFEIFRSVEEAIELPLIQTGFYTIEEFVARAQSILQRRKARSGRSLELHIREIFLEENLREGEHFQHQAESEPGRRPDFLFPSAPAYRNPEFPDAWLRMLAVKTTCKDRWRQILNEARRIERKHLLTLQEGVSESQFREMSEAQVQLVVPGPLIKSYPETIRPHLQTLESFIGDVRLLNLS